MSERGAEGILKARAEKKSGTGDGPNSKKTPEGIAALPDPLAKSTVRGVARPTVTDEDAKKKVKAAEKAQDEAKNGESEAGKKVGETVGRGIGSSISMGNEAAGFILGLLVWGWVVRPFFSGGVAGVKSMFMAKFFNKKSDGTEMP